MTDTHELKKNDDPWPLGANLRSCVKQKYHMDICKTYESPMVVRSNKKKRSQTTNFQKTASRHLFYLTQHTQQIEAVERTRQTLKSSKHQIPTAEGPPETLRRAGQLLTAARRTVGWCPSMRLMLAARQQWCLFLVFFPWNDSEIRRKMVRKNHQVRGGTCP